MKSGLRRIAPEVQGDVRLLCRRDIFYRSLSKVRTSSERGSLDAPQMEVRGTLKNKSVTARVCRTCPF